MEVSINYLAVFLAAVSTMVVGSIWYSPGVFGNMWMKLAKVKPEENMKGRSMASSMVITFGSAFILSLITAYVLAHVTFLSNHFFQHSFMQDALTTAFWLWLGFTAARLAMHDLFEGRRKKLTLINVLHEFVTIMVMALIIGAMGV